MATWLLVAAPTASAALPPGGTFMDDNGSGFEGAIEAIAAEGITSGCDPLSVLFCPTESVSRAQMAAFLVRALDLPAAPSAGFVDVSGSFTVAIDRLAAAGITRGCNPPANDRFCPAQAVTRAQMAAFLVRALGLTSHWRDHVQRCAVEPPVPDGHQPAGRGRHQLRVWRRPVLP